MASIIVTGNKASQSAIAATLGVLNKTGIGNPILIAPQMPEGMDFTGQFVSSANTPLGACLTQVLSLTTERQWILIEASAEIDTDRMAAMLSSLAAIRGQSFGYTILEHAGERIDLPDLAIDSVVQFLSNGEKLPLLCCCFPANLLEKLNLHDADTACECLASVLISAVTAGMPLVHSSVTLKLPETFDAGGIRLTTAATGRLLRQTLDLCNIEDLFPEHPWSAHQGESAAASYHTLAAIFIRCGDYEAANNCLSLGDTFEDSPRSLALKGFIAKERGEVLGAVANMISSLQQYELRKRNDNNEHYLSFKPVDLQIINTSMRDGLSALNKRDNDAALNCFTQAIVNFDSFYTDLGIDSSRRNG